MNTNIATQTTLPTHGAYIFGEYCGVKIIDKVIKSTGEQRKDFFLGLKVPKQNGYEGECVFVDIKLSTKQINAGIPGQFNHLTGKTIGVPFWTNNNAYKDRVYSTNFFDDKFKVLLSSGEATELKKAS